ncbi:MAG: hypothetical protein KUG78_18725 [Kangiellaceae bacterium]|nr:hypothetical protein [Kangiellaceae bacterium]
MDGAVPLFIGLVLLIGIITFLTSVVLVWISYRRTFKTDKAFMISMLNVLLLAIGCGFGVVLIDSAADYDALIFAGILLFISILVTIRISKRSETKWLE